MRTLLSLLLAASAAGCAIDRATTVPVRKELAANCQSDCAILDMRLTAVVIISNAGGCVCEPKSTPAGGEAPRAGASAAAGGAMVVAAQAAQAQSQSSTSTPSIPSIPSIR